MSSRSSSPVEATAKGARNSEAEESAHPKLGPHDEAPVVTITSEFSVENDVSDKADDLAQDVAKDADLGAESANDGVVAVATPNADEEFEAFMNAQGPSATSDGATRPVRDIDSEGAAPESLTAELVGPDEVAGIALSSTPAPADVIDLATAPAATSAEAEAEAEAEAGSLTGGESAATSAARDDEPLTAGPTLLDERVSEPAAPLGAEADDGVAELEDASALVIEADGDDADDKAAAEGAAVAAAEGAPGSAEATPFATSGRDESAPRAVSDDYEEFLRNVVLPPLPNPPPPVPAGALASSAPSGALPFEDLSAAESQDRTVISEAPPEILAAMAPQRPVDTQPALFSTWQQKGTGPRQVSLSPWALGGLLLASALGGGLIGGLLRSSPTAVAGSEPPAVFAPAAVAPARVVAPTITPLPPSESEAAAAEARAAAEAKAAAETAKRPRPAVRRANAAKRAAALAGKKAQERAKKEWVDPFSQ